MNVDRRTLQRLALLLGTLTLYVLTFPGLFSHLGSAVGAFGAIPVVLAGWLFGVWPGLLAGVLSILLNTLLFNWVGMTGWAVIITEGGGPGTLVLLLVGVGIGWLRDLETRLKDELVRRKQVEAVLEETSERFRSLFHNSPVSIWVEDFSAVKAYLKTLAGSGVEDLEAYLDRHPEVIADCVQKMRVLDVNRTTLNMFQAQSQEELDDHLDAILTEEAYPLLKDELIAIAMGATTFDGEGKNRNLDGVVRDIRLSFSAVPGHEDDLSEVIVTITDITDNKRAQLLIEQQSERSEAMAQVSKALTEAILNVREVLEVVVRHMSELIGDVSAIALVSDDGRVLDTAASSHNNSSYAAPLKAVLEQTSVEISDLVDRADGLDRMAFPRVPLMKFNRQVLPEYQRRMERAGIENTITAPLRAEGHVIGLLIAARSAGSDPYSGHERMLLDELASRASLAIVNARLHHHIHEQSRTDPLTGIHNRRYFTELAAGELKRARRYGHPVSVVMMDLDHFKRVNDNHGHRLGDQVLQLFVQRCRENVRTTDVLARYGGEEFVLLLPETDVGTAECVAERLRAVVADSPFKTDVVEISLTISLGIAGLDQDGTLTIDQLLDRADRAMYEAKQAGRDQVILASAG